MELISEFDFTLPRGLVDGSGRVHRQGTMRLATARDELAVERDRTVQRLPGYGTLVLLSRVITRLGELTALTPDLLENLFTQDLAYLREVYNRINQGGTAQIPTRCPACDAEFEVDLALAGE
ncbi:hypothetical protein [Leptolyngbya sp. PCC 6406]|uniref:hypothetical protein n=1 Tax=Leptolyngbya sp. PCC 6406 TaxID=1173264 RepID=UPI0002AD00BC|nr:hypothetical protein [Leptolyngbya sp. PCC 6406]